MSGECEKCGDHCLDCKCPVLRERKWFSKEEAKEMYPDKNELIPLGDRNNPPVKMATKTLICLLRILPPEGMIFKECTVCAMPFIYDGTYDSCLFCTINKEEKC